MRAEKTPGSGQDQPPRETEVQPADERYQARTAEAAAQAHAKRDAFHFTNEGALDDQKEFESAQRIHDRALGVVEGSLYSDKHVLNREANERENEMRAKEMNARRGILDRLLGRNKMTSDDVMHDEADRMNMLTDQRIMHEDGTMLPQEAHDEIARSVEFMPGRQNISGKENPKAVANLLARMRTSDPYIEFALNNGDARPLRNFVEKEMRENYDSPLEYAYTALIWQKMDSFIRSRNAAALVNLFNEEGLALPLNKKFIDELPPEILKYQEIRRGLRNRIVEQEGAGTDLLLARLEKREQEIA